MENQPAQTPTSQPPIPQPSLSRIPLVNQDKKSSKWLTIGLIILPLVSFGIVGVLAYQSYQLKKQTLKPPPASSPFINKQAITPIYKNYPKEKFTGSIAFLENNKLMIYSSQGKKEVIEEKGIVKFSWSADGTYIYYLTNNFSQDKLKLSSTIKRVSVSTSKNETIFNNTVNCEPNVHCAGVDDFDFARNDEILIAYDGLQKYNQDSQKITPLLKKQLIKEDGPMRLYKNYVLGIAVSPEKNYALLTLGHFESSSNQLFDLNANEYIEFKDTSAGISDFVTWMNNDTAYLGFTDCYRELGHLDIVSIQNKNVTRLAGNQKKGMCFPIIEAVHLPSGLVVFTLKQYDDYPWTTDDFYNDFSDKKICDTFFDSDQESCLPGESMGLIIALDPNDPDKFSVIKKLENIGGRKSLSLSGHELSKSPHGNSITFLMPHENGASDEKYVYMIDIQDGKPASEGVIFSFSGSGEQAFKKYLYQWSP